MTSLNTISFLSESDYNQRLIKSMFSVVSANWHLESGKLDAVDVILVDCDNVKLLKNKMQAKLFVAYASPTTDTTGFDARLAKPIRSRDLMNLLGQLKQMLETKSYSS